MIGIAYQAAAIRAVLGPGHSSEIPDVLWSGWLNGSLGVLAMTGLTVSHDSFGESGLGVANSDEIDGGVSPASTPAYFGLFDSDSGGSLIAYAPVTFDTAPSSGDPLLIEPGALTFVYDDGTP